MSGSEARPAAQVPLPDGTAAEVRLQLARIVSHPLFGHSKRYPAFLRYVVDQTLSGRAEELKERTIGVEALGRPPAYDTNQDPVVRSTAAEVRRRLAQFYEEGGGGQVRITIPVGSYVPQFHAIDAPPVDDAQAAPPASRTPVPRGPATRRLRMVLLGAGVVLLATVAAGLFSPSRRSTPVIDLFWAPFAGAGAVTIAVGRAAGVEADEQYVTINAATALSKITAFLHSKQAAVDVKTVETVDFGALRARPVVTIGAFNNQWSMRVTQPLRFGYENRGSGTGLQIVDRHGSGTVRWARRFDGSVSPALVVEDLAVVARVRHPDSGQMVLVVGGIGTQGTSAAGEFVTESRYLDAWAQTLAPGWHEQNVEVVISTKVHDGVAGRPHVVATHVWR